MCVFGEGRGEGGLMRDIQVGSRGNEISTTNSYLPALGSKPEGLQ